MARRKFEKTFNTFVGGLNTEASELNFPENTSLHDKNFLLRTDGGRDRRKGMGVMGPMGLILTSPLYPIETDDGISPSVKAPSVAWGTPPMDVMSVGAAAPSVKVVSTVRYLTYDNYKPETISVGALAPAVSVVSQVRYLTYDRWEPESINAGMSEPTVKIDTVAARLTYEMEIESILVGVVEPSVKVVTQ